MRAIEPSAETDQLVQRSAPISQFEDPRFAAHPLGKSNDARTRMDPSLTATHVGLGAYDFNDTPTQTQPLRRLSQRRNTDPQDLRAIPGQVRAANAQAGENASLAAMRFVVAESPSEGTLTLRLLGGNEDAPPGVPSAVLVPKSPRDASWILQLLYRTERA